MTSSISGHSHTTSRSQSSSRAHSSSNSKSRSRTHHTSKSDSKTCTVPLFLSTKAQRSMYSQAHSRHHKASRSQQSHNTVPDMFTAGPAKPYETNTTRIQPDIQDRGSAHQDNALPIDTNQSEPDDMYAAYPPPQRQDTSTVSLPSQSSVSSRSHGSSRSVTSRSGTSAHSHRPHKSTTGTTAYARKRRTTKTTRVARLAYHTASKKRLTISSAITFGAATIVYVALFATHTASGALFHVTSILLALTLLGIAVHSGIRWMMLKSELAEAREIRDKKRKSPRERGWAISRPYGVKIGGRDVERDTELGVLGDDEVPEEGMRVYMHDDEDLEAGVGCTVNDRLRHGGADIADVPAPAESRLNGLAGSVKPHAIRMPPPTYGNFRNSVRMNPNFLQTHRVNNGDPSPSTPTYEEAIRPNRNTGPKLPGMPGYRPPSYGSEGGLTAVLETRRRDVEEAMGRFHPLERDRLGQSRYQG